MTCIRNDMQMSLESDVEEVDHPASSSDCVDIEKDAMTQLQTPLLSEETSSVCSESQEEEVTQKKSWTGPLLLLLTCFLFATLNVCLRTLYLIEEPPLPSALSAIRGWVALVVFLPIMCHRKLKQRIPSNSELTPPKAMWIASLEMAFWNFAGQALYNVGIVFVSSARASFLGQTTVVMVPIICAMKGEMISYWNGLGCCSSLLGLILLSADNDNGNDDSSNHHRFSFGIGDALILGSTVCWSFYIICMSKYAHFYDEVFLQGSKNAFLAVFYAGWVFISWNQSVVSLWPGWRNGIAWAILIYSALGPGVIADLLQQKGQESSGATESNLILCVESVFTAVLGRVLLGEETSWVEKLGGAFLMAGAFVSGQ